MRKEMVEAGSDFSIRRQCSLLGISRSGLYYQPRGAFEGDVEIMRLIDEQYTGSPFYGVERMSAWLNRNGVKIGHNKVRRLMRTMGLEAVYPKPRLSVSSPEHRIYPYLLNGLKIFRPNQVWAADITYIRLTGGFVYLTAVMDWFSRYVLSWRLSTSPDTEFCTAALEDALSQARPEIFNSDQGCQYTSREFTSVLKKADVRISMDGRGRVFDNIFVERLWRSVKYEEVHIHDYGCVGDARQGIGKYFKFYNKERLHQSLGYITPEEVYRERLN
jgi:putative transposase